MKNYFAQITDVNDSCHCYQEKDIVEIIAEINEDGETKYVAQQTGTDYQQSLTKDEFKRFTPSMAKQYIGFTGDMCHPDQTASPCLIHFIEPNSSVKIIEILKAEWHVKVYSEEQDITQNVDIRDIEFNEIYTQPSC